jgi:hypothetical protein
MAPVLSPHPEYCPGTYDLDLYCKYENPDHRWDEFPWNVCEFQTYGQSAAWARSQGWILHRDNTATCPKCAAALGKSKAA